MECWSSGVPEWWDEPRSRNTPPLRYFTPPLPRFRHILIENTPLPRHIASYEIRL